MQSTDWGFVQVLTQCDECICTIAVESFAYHAKGVVRMSSRPFSKRPHRNKSVSARLWVHDQGGAKRYLLMCASSHSYSDVQSHRCFQRMESRNVI